MFQCSITGCSRSQPEHADASRIEDQVRADGRVEAHPADGQDPQHVGVGHAGHVPGAGPHPGDHPVDPGRHLVERLAAGHPVGEEVPPGPVLRGCRAVVSPS